MNRRQIFRAAEEAGAIDPHLVVACLEKAVYAGRPIPEVLAEFKRNRPEYFFDRATEAATHRLASRYRHEHRRY